MVGMLVQWRRATSAVIAWDVSCQWVPCDQRKMTRQLVVDEDLDSSESAGIPP